MTTLEETEQYFNTLVQKEGQLKTQKQFQKLGKELFIKKGLPKQKEESFQYVLLKPILEKIQAKRKEEASQALVEKETHQLVFVNGQFREDLSDWPKAVLSITQAANPSSLAQFLNKQGLEVLQNEQNPLVALNFALDSYGVLISLKKFAQATHPLRILMLTDGMEESLLSPRIAFYLAEGAKLSVEIIHKTLEPSSFTNLVCVAQLEENAVLNIVSATSQGQTLSHQLRAEVKQKAALNWTTMNLDSFFLREDIQTKLTGVEASCQYSCLNLTKENHQAHNYTKIEHLAESTTSHQHVKNLSFDHSRTSFEGKIFVDKVAQQTKAYQLNQNMVLSEKAANFSKPNLEIFADDVKASHGATFTKLGEEELFYLKSRGLDEKTASSYLILGFVEEMLSKVENAELAHQLRKEMKELI